MLRQSMPNVGNTTEKAPEFWTAWFVLWVLLFSVAVYLIPVLSAPLRSLIVPGLGIIVIGKKVTQKCRVRESHKAVSFECSGHLARC